MFRNVKKLILFATYGRTPSLHSCSLTHLRSIYLYKSIEEELIGMTNIKNLCANLHGELTVVILTPGIRLNVAASIAQG